ncbi:MAG TPA: threonylcarbamoyl-AMP synthase [bacterium (Candidatus Stahlbacteria)]|nr:threonylcarbamoyl-AMP synthase [Candidatus Stahlbacteria bacterium]
MIVRGRKGIEKAIQSLERGSIIAFPTDTIYGIGCCAYKVESIDQIYRIKRRTRDKPLILFIKERKEVEKYCFVSAIGKKLIDKFWPGALTLVFKAKADAPWTAANGTLGVRIPNNDIILEILSKYGKPLATTSANYEGVPVFSSAQEIEDAFGKEIGVVVDGGVCRENIPSTVLDVSSHTAKLLRKGKVGIIEIESEIGSTVKLANGISFAVLFVCTANVGRSPMAAGILKNEFSEKNVEVTSCGINASYGAKPEADAVTVMNEIGIDISAHKARILSLKAVREADLILVMEHRHKERVLEVDPTASSKVWLLGSLTRKKQTEIDDPIGRGKKAYKKCRDTIKENIEVLVQDIKRRF